MKQVLWPPFVCKLALAGCVPAEFKPDYSYLEDVTPDTESKDLCLALYPDSMSWPSTWIYSEPVDGALYFACPTVSTEAREALADQGAIEVDFIGDWTILILREG